MNLDYITILILAVGEVMCDTKGIGSPEWIWHAFVLRMCDFYCWVPRMLRRECTKEPDEGTQLKLEWKP
jgi:hypothetical protein